MTFRKKGARRGVDNQRGKGRETDPACLVRRTRTLKMRSKRVFLGRNTTSTLASLPLETVQETKLPQYRSSKRARYKREIGKNTLTGRGLRPRLARRHQLRLKTCSRQGNRRSRRHSCGNRLYGDWEVFQTLFWLAGRNLKDKHRRPPLKVNSQP